LFLGILRPDWKIFDSREKSLKVTCLFKLSATDKKKAFHNVALTLTGVDVIRKKSWIITKKEEKMCLALKYITPYYPRRHTGILLPY
jgi:hypothetical protein